MGCAKYSTIRFWKIFILKIVCISLEPKIYFMSLILRAYIQIHGVESHSLRSYLVELCAFLPLDQCERNKWHQQLFSLKIVMNSLHSD